MISVKHFDNGVEQRLNFSGCIGLEKRVHFIFLWILMHQISFASTRDRDSSTSVRSPAAYSVLRYSVAGALWIGSALFADAGPLRSLVCFSTCCIELSLIASTLLSIPPRGGPLGILGFPYDIHSDDVWLGSALFRYRSPCRWQLVRLISSVSLASCVLFLQCYTMNYSVYIFYNDYDVGTYDCW